MWLYPVMTQLWKCGLVWQSGWSLPKLWLCAPFPHQSNSLEQTCIDLPLSYIFKKNLKNSLHKWFSINFRVIQWSLTPGITFMLLTPPTKSFQSFKEMHVKLSDNSIKSFRQFACFCGCFHKFQTKLDVLHSSTTKKKITYVQGCDAWTDWNINFFSRGGANKSLVRPTSRCYRTKSIVLLERGVCSCAELQVFYCYRGWKEAW